jgi:hypothetical protein
MSFGYGEIESDYEFSFNGKSHLKGNVHIGDEANPTNATLAVEGTIYSREVNVKYGDIWPDDVFKSNYKLNSLEEILSYTQKQKHLPGIPSEDEIKNNGVNVVALQAELLRKIEELFIHCRNLEIDNQEIKKELNKFKNEK